jgi:Protein of unknown function (DUF2281)
MTSIESQLIERLKKLPPSRVAEVVDFVEFLAVREERAAAAQRLTEGLARLDALRSGYESARLGGDRRRAAAAPRRWRQGGRVRVVYERSAADRIARCALAKQVCRTPGASEELTPAGIVDDLRRLAVVVSPHSVPAVVTTDPDDDHVLAAALAGQADLIASGGKRDLLPLGSYQGIAIVTAREAVQRLEARGKV